jgi:sugar phosphate isomerase/epimerase
MDIGLVHFMAVPGIIKDEGPIVESAAKIAEDDFFSVLEVRRSKNPEVMQGLKQVADSAHMSLGVGAQPGLLLGKLSLNNPDEGGRRAAIEEVKQSLDAAYFFGSRLCVVLTGPDPGEAERERGLDLLVDSCNQLCQYCKDQAKDYVCYLSVEQFDDKHDKKCLIGPSDITARLAERVRESHDNFGITVDLSHIPMIGENYYDWLGTLQPYIVHVHAGNCLISDQQDVAYGDMHPRFGYPGGENDLPELKAYLEALIYIGYFQSEVPTGKPIFTFEVKPYGNDTTELVLANTKRVFKEAWAQLQA